ncbi:hypothetical protein PBI_VIVALDI_53 [Mycobacterium phage Vivaldi]|nr:hypothetical protein PBI_VIVALDI_53 [Mycobacterium phage Vivaldi]AYD86697.1 hypothetical protein SEA_MESH1_52 [Mycobacterium phage Mesh1]
MRKIKTYEFACDEHVQSRYTILGEERTGLDSCDATITVHGENAYEAARTAEGWSIVELSSGGWHASCPREDHVEW